jgi:hypothetical protein
MKLNENEIRDYWRNQAITFARAEMEWSRFFSLLPAAGDYGTQKLFRRK